MPDDKSYLPDPSEIIHTITIGPTVADAAAVAHSFRILRTNELDSYETPKTKAVVEASAAAAATAGDNFTGTDRKAAKISVAAGAASTFDDLSALLDSLPADTKMVALKIPIGATSGRVKEERKNVRVTAWLYAASRESDNDFHVILGRDPAKTPRRYMNSEVSGLPPGGPALATLKAARSSFQRIVQQTPGLGYDFYDPPIAVTVEGSLFFDTTHAHGGTPGPTKVKPKTIWEIHPVTNIKPRTA